MKATGIVLTVVGGLMLLSGISRAFTTHNLNLSHDVSKLAGGLGVSALILAAGIALIIKSGAKR